VLVNWAQNAIVAYYLGNGVKLDLEPAKNKPLLPGFSLGNYHIDAPLVLAPMAGITDLPFRQICKRFGVGLVVTEMIASRAVDTGRERTERMAEINPDEHPVAIQIAGSDPVFVSDAARWAVDHGADFVDINMGCPVKKICKQISGSALLRDEKLVARIIDAVVAAVDVPVTLKIRSGWDEKSKNVESIARIAEESGIRLLTVHGRTRSQMFHGRANWEDIGRARAAVSIPVIGNGDITDAASAREMIRISNCDGIMVGRAVQGNPWVLGEVYAALTGQEEPMPPTPAERWKIINEHMQYLLDFHGMRTASKLARKHVIWYSRGLHGSADFRGNFQTMSDWQQMMAYAENYFLALDGALT
jgi:tRNA-dihydrouridine synthase B